MVKRPGDPPFCIIFFFLNTFTILFYWSLSAYIVFMVNWFQFPTRSRCQFIPYTFLGNYYVSVTIKTTNKMLRTKYAPLVSFSTLKNTSDFPRRRKIPLYVFRRHHRSQWSDNTFQPLTAHLNIFFCKGIIRHLLNLAWKRILPA